MKINGPMWKYVKFDRKETVEKQRKIALEAAAKQNYSPDLINEINRFFDNQFGSMDHCDACGDEVKNIFNIGSAKLCKKCYSKINKEQLNKKDFCNNQEVEDARTFILKIANKNNFSQMALKGINEFFDSKIEQGLIDSVIGEDQMLKAFEDHIELITYDSFDVEEMELIYSSIIRKSNSKTPDLVSEGINAAQTVVSGVLRGRGLTGSVIKAGVGFIASSSVADAAVDKISKVKTPFDYKIGKMELSYSDIDAIEYVALQQINKDDQMGCIRITNSRHSNNYIVFFFDQYSASNSQKVYSIIKGKRNDKIRTQDASVQSKSQVNSQIGFSVADEILKFKQLLDMEVITEEEFESKKKELLSK